jgi:hypothetical protein
MKMKSSYKGNFSFSEIENDLKSKPFYTLFFNLMVLSLFFIQALRAYVPGVYVAMFHVVFGHNIVENLLILLTLIFFTLPGLTNTLCKKFGIRRVAIYSIYCIAICRLLIAFHLPNIWQTILSGIIIAIYGTFISTILTLWFDNDINGIKSNNKIIFAVFSILCAFLLDYLIRTIGFTQDISLLPPGLNAEYWYITQYLWLIIQIPLTVVCIYYTRVSFPQFRNDASSVEGKDKKGTVYSLLFVGIGMFWFLLFNIFLYPNIIAHYTDSSYYISNILSIIAVIIVILTILSIKKKIFLNIKVTVILNCFMIVSISLFLFLGRILTYFAVILVSISLIIMYLNFFLLFSRMSTIIFKWEKVKTISNAFAIGLVFYILFTVLHIFTTDWAYIISAFKGIGPIIILIAIIILSVSTIISNRLTKQGGKKE